MNSMKVGKDRLRAIVNTNRAKHYTLFLEAQKVYKDLVIKELDQMLADARAGSNIRRRVNLRAPENHVNDYDRLMGLFDLSEDLSVELTIAEYDCYVNDNWSWAKVANTLNTNYTSHNVSPMWVGEDSSMPTSY